MDPPVLVSFDIVVSGTSSASVIPVVNPSLPANHLYLGLDKPSLFPSGIGYHVGTDASGFVQTLDASGATPLSFPHLTARTAGANTQWVLAASNASRIVDLAVAFDGGATRVVPLSAASAAAAVPTASLGAQVTYAVARLLSLPSSPVQPAALTVLQSSAAVTAELNASLITVLADVLTAKSVLDTLLSILLTTDGPIYDTSPGQHTLSFQPGMRNITLILNIRSLAVDVRYPGLVQHSVQLGDLPLVVGLTDV